MPNVVHGQSRNSGFGPQDKIPTCVPAAGVADSLIWATPIVLPVLDVTDRHFVPTIH